MLNTLSNALLYLPPEMAHRLGLQSLKLLSHLGWKNRPYSAPLTCMGLHFKNPFGVAAGLDKNADYVDALFALGFGFVEVGTVTPKAQPGNAKPRLFRLKKERAIINRMGFNNHGMHRMKEKLSGRKFPGILGINIGKNRDTPLDRATEDYLECYTMLAPVADYIAINISSPNTPGLRNLHASDHLHVLLKALKNAQAEIANKIKRYVPLVIKISPDLHETDLVTLAEQLIFHKVDGVIAGNTTISRNGIENNSFAKEIGGLSGSPLRHKATEVILQLAPYLKGKIPIIGCGGIFTKADADEKFQAGASLIQVYTGLIYQGPVTFKIIAGE